MAQKDSPSSVRTVSPSQKSPAALGRAEHISIEAEPDSPPQPAHVRNRSARASYSLASRLRGCETELVLLEEHYLAVRSVRPHQPACEYDLDLRFASPRPVRVRHVSWFWMFLALALALLGAGALWSMRADPLMHWQSLVFLTSVCALLAACGAAALFVRHTVESLEFRSEHGGARLVSVAGGIGSTRAGKAFFVELIKSIQAAKVARAQPLPHFLRDEMREHHRLRTLGVLSEQEYETSKARILAAH